MGQHSIIVTITPAGDSTVAVDGCVGPSCKDLTRNLERALGATTGETRKPEFTQGEVQRATEHQS
jgi:hypothetical protein